MNLEHSKILMPPDTAHEMAVCYVRSTLSRWSKAEIKSPLVAYWIYLSFTALYDDGREAQDACPYTKFETIENAVRHAGVRSSELLKKLEEIGYPKEEDMTGWVTARGMCTIEFMFGQLTKCIEENINEYKEIPRDDLKKVTVGREKDQSGTEIFSVIIQSRGDSLPMLQMGVVNSAIRVNVGEERDLIHLTHMFDTKTDACCLVKEGHPYSVEELSRDFLERLLFPS